MNAQAWGSCVGGFVVGVAVYYFACWNMKRILMKKVHENEEHWKARHKDLYKQIDELQVTLDGLSVLLPAHWKRLKTERFGEFGYPVEVWDAELVKQLASRPLQQQKEQKFDEIYSWILAHSMTDEA